MTAERLGRLKEVLYQLLLFLAILAVLYFGREILMPLAFAILISLALAPLVGIAQRAGLHRIPSVLLVAGALFALIGWLGWTVTGQVADLAGRLPEHRETLRKRMDVLRGPTARLLGRAYDTVQELGREAVDRAAPAASTGAAKVEVVKASPGSMEMMGGAVGAAFGAAAKAAMVVILVLFLLVFQNDLRDRLTYLAGASRVNVNLRMVEEAAAQTSRYLLLQTAGNLLFGIAFAGSLLALGVPNPVLWGALAALLKYIPYLGTTTAALLPFTFSLMIFEDWSRPLLILGIFALFELVTNYGIEPLVYSRGAGLSPLAVVLSAVFWGWIWGGLGIILAVPIMSTLVTLGRHLPPLRFLHRLFGRSPGLEPEFRLYNRLSAGDLEGAVELVEEHRAGKTLQQLFDLLLVPALALAERNRHVDPAEDPRSEEFYGRMKDLLTKIDGPIETPPVGAGEEPPEVAVLILPVADEADELCAQMLARLLRDHRLRSRVLDASITTGDKAEQVERFGTEVLCLSALPPGAILQSRYLVKRIRSRDPGREILLGLWAGAEEASALSGRISADDKVRVLGTLGEAADAIREKVASIQLAATGRSGTRG